MRTKISITAGNILTLIEDADHRMSLEEIKNSVDAPSELVLMSLGWLVYEGYVQMNQMGGEYSIHHPVEKFMQVAR
jgi:hypothetical protein